MASDRWRHERVIGLENGFVRGGLCVGKTAALPHKIPMASIQHSGAMMTREETVPGSVTRSNRHRSNTTRSEVWEEDRKTRGSLALALSSIDTHTSGGNWPCRRNESKRDQFATLVPESLI